jgi:hypothetical protein
VIAFTHRPGSVTRSVTDRLAARRWRRLPVVVDGIALAQASRECLTIMRGDWATARVVHTPLDTADRLTLSGVAEVARAVATALTPHS